MAYDQKQFDELLADISKDTPKDTSLILTLLGLDDADVSNLLQAIDSNAKYKKSLQLLDLSHNEIESREKLSFCNFPSLQVVNLSYNALVMFPEFLECPKLKKINVSNNKIYLNANKISLPSLEQLDLQNNMLTEMPDITGSANLQYLNLENNRRIKSFYASEQYANIKNLWIMEGNSFSPDALNALQQFREHASVKQQLLFAFKKSAQNLRVDDPRVGQRQSFQPFGA